MRNYLFIFAFLFVAMISGCCGGGGSSDSLKLVPAGIDVLVDINVKSLLNDSNVTDNIIDPVTKKKMTLDEAFAKAKAQTGMDLKTLERINIFLDFPIEAMKNNRPPDPNTIMAGAVISGSFNKQEILDSIKKETGTEPVAVEEEGQQVYETPDKKAKATILNSKHLVIGTGKAVSTIIGLNAGKGASVGKEVTDVLSAASADAYIRIALVLPDEFKQIVLKQAPPQAKILEKINNLMLSYSKGSSNTYALSITAKAVDTEGATQLKTALEGLMAMGKMMAMQKPELGKMMETLKLESSGDMVTIKLEIDPELMKKAAQGF